MKLSITFLSLAILALSLFVRAAPVPGKGPEGPKVYHTVSSDPEIEEINPGPSSTSRHPGKQPARGKIIALPTGLRKRGKATATVGHSLRAENHEAIVVSSDSDSEPEGSRAKMTSRKRKAPQLPAPPGMIEISDSENEGSGLRTPRPSVSKRPRPTGNDPRQVNAGSGKTNQADTGADVPQSAATAPS